MSTVFNGYNGFNSYNNYPSYGSLQHNFDSPLSFNSIANSHYITSLDNSGSNNVPNLIANNNGANNIHSIHSINHANSNPGMHSLKRSSSAAALDHSLNSNGANSISSTNSSSSSIQNSKPAHQPRKKRECPICHNFFSNLTTHKTIHNKDSKPFICSTCNRAFKRLNDLIRHEKCHLSQLGEWEFQCPYHPGADLLRSNRGEICHHTGFFTRCDTYKNHLKAIHFRYPPNTLKSERLRVSGHCRECGAYFDNVQEWLSKHIETNQCPKMINPSERKRR